MKRKSNAPQHPRPPPERNILIQTEDMLINTEFESNRSLVKDSTPSFSPAEPPTGILAILWTDDITVGYCLVLK